MSDHLEVAESPPASPPPGFTWTYAYCQYPQCYAGSSVALIEEATGRRWSVCNDHANHRPPVATDNKWRRPGSRYYTSDGRP